MRIVTAIMCALLLCIASSASAEEIQRGTEYVGPKTLGIEAIGVSFKLPSGWSGGLPQGDDTFLVGREGLNGRIFLVAQESTVAEAKAEMSKPISMPPISMTPKGEVKVSGDRLTNAYTVMGGEAPLEGHAIARIGKTGWGVMVLAIAPQAELATFVKTAEAIAASVKIVKPKVPKATRDGHWGKALSGKRIIRFYSGSGYGEKTQISLCTNGRFYFGFEANSVTQNGTGAAVSSKSGVWSATGKATGGTLSLRYDDGRTADYNLVQSDDKLMIDGKRWFREPVDCN